MKLAANSHYNYIFLSLGSLSPELAVLKAIAGEQRESLKRSTNEQNNPDIQLPTAEVSSLLSHSHSLTSIAARHSNPSMQVERIVIRARRLAGNQEAFSQCVNT